MVSAAFGACFVIATAVFIYMAQKNYNNIDVYTWTIVLLVPIAIMAYWLKTLVEGPEAAAFLFCFVYLDSTFLVVTVMFSMLHTLDIPIKPWVVILAYGAAALHVAIVCLSVHTQLYYDSIAVVHTGLGNATRVTSGPLKIYHTIFLVVVFVWFVATLLAGAIREGRYSRRTFFVYSVFIAAGILVNAVESFAGADFTMLPVLYTIGVLVIAVDYDYMHSHDIAYVLSDQQQRHGTRGYVAIGLDRRFLSCNEKAHDYLPFLRKQRVDEKIGEQDERSKMILDLVDSFERDGQSSVRYQVGDMTCACEISAFSVRPDGDTQGYLLDIRDATEEQRNYDIITSYNETLNAEVIEKTNSIRDMQRKVVLGMANMIENRDNNTGGHVKRTSDIIHIIVDEIIRQGIIPMTDEMQRDIVRAAPTHDLGKITIDSNILNKPGRFTDEEYEIMKTHSVKSGEMVLILLEGVEEERFVQVAYNVARYHHERWDGRGYPEGLVGTMIPLEARIMAVADVYDALVSKRVYKDPMSFEQAYTIMCDCMGTQFDPSMKSVFIGCREQLEDYYRQHGA